MKNPVVALFLLTVSALAFSGMASAETQPGDEQQLRELKTVLWPKAYREQDTKLLSHILDDGFQMIDANGFVSSKADELSWIAANKPSYESFEYTIERLEIHGNDSAVISGMGVVRNGKDSKNPLVRYRSTNMLVKQDGTWRAVASHVSMLDSK